MKGKSGSGTDFVKIASSDFVKIAFAINRQGDFEKPKSVPDPDFPAWS
jgi:hypothetical protein